ncbi:serine/threonine-protein kinase Nek8 [Thalassophryne amazonica]|uniref:serine/threonine-protein kinase Nek8 n=1 Tax=Thalassophryne amazonica TaxID=390379 RepID=UPI0014715803|nr:serine/threonine-protein kinase Nek8 [Thalassophryne amazonica]
MAYSTSTVAEGCFGKVYKEMYNDKWAAGKEGSQHLISQKDLERECEVYNEVNSPNIVKLLGDITLKDRKWIIPLEFIFGENLETTIFKTSKSKIKLTPCTKATIIIGMCEGLLHLHSKDIVHQDLKPENIMVEHETNRAVIIDLGLAKFFRHGLNSAIDMGNPAYAPPEVLMMGCQRDQRSDVWAMGKIIAELCARIRLYTPSVCPEKIKETLQGQPYCNIVCRMVQTDPSLRVSMAAVMSDIRRAGGAGIVINTFLQIGQLHLPSPNLNTRNRSSSPVNRSLKSQNRDASPMRASPVQRDPSPMRSPLFQRDPSPLRSPLLQRDQSPMRSPLLQIDQSLMRSPLLQRDQSPMRSSLLQRDQSPMRSPLLQRDPSPMNRCPSPLNWEPKPKSYSTTLCPEVAPFHSLSSERTQAKKKHQLAIPCGGSDPTHDFAKMRLYQETTEDLLCNLPTTGRVVVQRFEEKNGEIGAWEQKEVVTQDGKIVKFDNVRFDTK